MQAMGHLSAIIMSLASVAAPTGTLEGVVEDASGQRVADVPVVLRSPQLIGGPARTRTDQSGQFRFARLAAGAYEIEVGDRVEDVLVDAGAHVERRYTLGVGASGGVDRVKIAQGFTITVARASAPASGSPCCAGRCARVGVALLRGLCARVALVRAGE
jgi:hypothetical protein